MVLADLYPGGVGRGDSWYKSGEEKTLDGPEAMAVRRRSNARTHSRVSRCLTPLPCEEGTTWMDLKTMTCTLRSECCLDCLICSEFARPEVMVEGRWGLQIW
jgi:hypothetical protein